MSAGGRCESEAMHREGNKDSERLRRLPWRGAFTARALLAHALLALSVSSAVRAQEPPPQAVTVAEVTASERNIKAAFLYKFTAYVEWPESAFARPDTPLTFGVMGDEPIAAELARLATGRSVDGRPLAVRRLREGEPLAGLHVLFIGRAEGARIEQISRAAGTRPILIVTESEGALAQGSAINFVVSESRVKFAIAAESAEKRSLKLSSRLLTVAQNMGGP